MTNKRISFKVKNIEDAKNLFQERNNNQCRTLSGLSNTIISLRNCREIDINALEKAELYLKGLINGERSAVDTIKRYGFLGAD
jgi:hypothetical protein